MSAAASQGGRLSELIAAAALGVMLVCLLLAATGVGRGAPGLFQPGKPGSGSFTPTETPAPTQYVTRLVRVRSAPTGEGSSILDTLQRGASLEGTWVLGADGQTPWLRVARPGGVGYVWGKNLSGVARAPLNSSLGQELVVGQQTAIRSDPGAESAQIDVIEPGTRLQAVGTVGDLYEIALKKGGVGYIPIWAAAAAPSQSEPTTAPSFSCASATTWDERLICSDAPLAAADRRIAELYGQAMNGAPSDDARIRLRSAQRTWISQRRECERASDQVGCLRMIYQSRAGELGSASSLF